jgi:hypothetical protein
MAFQQRERAQVRGLVRGIRAHLMSNNHVSYLQAHLHALGTPPRLANPNPPRPETSGPLGCRTGLSSPLEVEISLL